MPGKSRRGRGKHVPHGKRKKGRRASPPVASQQQAISAAPMPAPSTSVPAPAATPIEAHYPYMIPELRRIGILTGIMVVTLVVLALVFS